LTPTPWHHTCRARCSSASDTSTPGVSAAKNNSRWAPHAPASCVALAIAAVHLGCGFLTATRIRLMAYIFQRLLASDGDPVSCCCRVMLCNHVPRDGSQALGG